MGGGYYGVWVGTEAWGRVDGLPVVDRCLVMGVVNVTPDSFSDGGEWFEPTAAIKHGRELLAEGADLLDVGGESTRPGAERPAPEEEIRRVLPVIEALAADGALISVDTMRAGVAELALDAGAVMINDVSGGQADPDMLPLVAERRTPYVCMHWRGHSIDMQNKAEYDDVVAEVIAELGERLEAMRAAGVDLTGSHWTPDSVSRRTRTTTGRFFAGCGNLPYWKDRC